MKAKIISIDFQKDFTTEGGVCFEQRSSVDFVKNTLVPYLEKKKIKIAEIVSDYRQPRLGDRGDCCRPGEWGYESEIPTFVKDKDILIKCMNSPIWTRMNIGDATKKPGLPYQDPEKFSKWIQKVVGRPENTEIILIGLTLDCCVLCVAQELDFRGYRVHVLKEAVDTYSGSQGEKELLCKSPIENWADIISWKKLKPLLDKK